MNKGINLVRAAIALAMFVPVVELCARVDDYFTYGAPILFTYNSETMYMRDHIGKKGKPYGHYRKWRLNSLGFRGPDLQPGRINILCFGASETFGLYEGEGLEYPRQLESALNRQAGSQRFQIVNAAYPGESIQTAAARIPETVEESHPRVALIYTVPANYIWLPYLASSKPKAVSKAPVQQPVQRFELRITERVRTLLKSLLPNVVQNKLREREIKRDEASFKVMATLPEANLQKYREDVELMLRTLRDHNVVPVLLTHINSFGPGATRGRLSAADRYMLTSWRKFYPMIEEEGLLDMETRMNAVVRSIAASENVSLIDVALQVPPVRENFADFAHFTDRGAGIVAEQIAKGLEPIVKDLQPAR